jgi:hypothetical protein
VIRLRRRRFLLLLVALISLLVGYPVVGGLLGEPRLFDVLLTLVFLAAFFVVFREGPLRWLALLMGGLTAVGVWTGYVLPGLPRPPLVVAFHSVAALFFVVTAATIMRVIFREPVVTADSVYGAFCSYVLIGMVFGHLYCILETVVPGSFVGTEEFAAQLRDENRRHFLLTYFSLVTLTTVGYGDIAPARESARGLVAVEAIVGQFYLAVLIAEVIGKRVSQALSGAELNGTGGGTSSRGRPES